MAVIQQIERCMQVEAARYPLTGLRFALVRTLRLLHALLREQALICLEHQATQTEDSHSTC